MKVAGNEYKLLQPQKVFADFHDFLLKKTFDLIPRHSEKYFRHRIRIGIGKIRQTLDDMVKIVRNGWVLAT